MCIIINLLKTKDKVKKKKSEKMSQRKTIGNTASFLKQWTSKKVVQEISSGRRKKKKNRQPKFYIQCKYSSDCFRNIPSRVHL